MFDWALIWVWGLIRVSRGYNSSKYGKYVFGFIRDRDLNVFSSNVYIIVLWFTSQMKLLRQLSTGTFSKTCTGRIATSAHESANLILQCQTFLEYINIYNF